MKIPSLSEILGRSKRRPAAEPQWSILSEAGELVNVEAPSLLTAIDTFQRQNPGQVVIGVLPAACLINERLHENGMPFGIFVTLTPPKSTQAPQ